MNWFSIACDMLGTLFGPCLRNRNSGTAYSTETSVSPARLHGVSIQESTALKCASFVVLFSPNVISWLNSWRGGVAGDGSGGIEYCFSQIKQQSRNHPTTTLLFSFVVFLITRHLTFLLSGLCCLLPFSTTERRSLERPSSLLRRGLERFAAIKRTHTGRAGVP